MSLYGIGKSQELGNHVQIGNRLKEAGDLSKVSVDAYLLKKGLGQPVVIFFSSALGLLRIC